MAYTDLNDSLSSFLRQWEGSLPSPELPKAYLPLALDMLRGDEELVRRTIKLLSNNITAWAKKYSPAYKNHEGIIDKSFLENKNSWYVPEIAHESQQMYTSGSTTGQPFSYLRWETILRPIEITNHYKMILQEFDLEQKPKVLYLLLNITKNGHTIEILPGSANFSEQHGADEAEVHFVERTALYANPDEFYKTVIEHLCEHPVDVILSSGMYMNSLTHYIKKLGVKQRLATLLSSTCDMLIYDDTDWLQDNGIVTHVCDHMRCWDGGATFFTCKYGVYHLLDNLSYCYSDNRRLISTDYFSLPSPFVNYWNGDYCYIEDDYKRCECGRLHRPFQFLKNRPVFLKGRTIARWEEEIEATGICGVKQVKCDIDSIEVITAKDLTQCEQNILREIMKGFLVNFRTIL